MANTTGPARTSIGVVAAAGTFARGYDLAEDLVGNVGFSAYFYLLVTGEAPTAKQIKMLDAMLVALGDPSLNASHQAARIAFASNPAALQLSMASGYLAASPKLVKDVDACVHFLTHLKQEIYEADHSAAHILKERLKAIKEMRGAVPGLGGEKQSSDDMAMRLVAVAEREKFVHTYVTLAKQLHFEYGRVFENRRPISLELVIASLQLELEYPPHLTRYLPWLAQAGTLLAHLAEEHRRPIADVLMSAGVEAVRYDNESD